MNYCYSPQSLPQDFVRYNEKRLLKKNSNGLGMFVLVYFLTMQFTATAIYYFFSSYTDNNSFVFLLDMFASVFSAFIPGLFYFLLSKKRITKIIPAKHVKFTFLLPLLCIGMAFSMLGNVASNIIQNNIALFGLKNSIDFNTEVSSVTEVLLYFVSTALVPAFAEEFAFRGVLMGSLRKYGDAFAIVISSIMFGAMHGNIVQIPFAFMLGLIFGYADCKTNSIFPSIIIHFINNFYAVLMTVAQDNANISSNTFYVIDCFVMVMFCILGLLSFVYLAKTQKGFFKMSSTEPTEYPYSNTLSFGEKVKSFLLSPAVIVVLVIFSLEMTVYLFPILS